MSNAQDKRDAAIRTIVENFIGMEGSDLGKLITARGFGDLVLDVSELKNLGRTERWNEGIRQWLATIRLAVETFASEQQMSEALVWDLSIDDLTFTTGREFASALKWAIFQGSTYAYAKSA